MKARVFVTPKKGVLDPQGKAIHGALIGLHFGGVTEVKQGRFFEIDLQNISRNEAEGQVKQMCEKLLANTVMEDYRFELME